MKKSTKIAHIHHKMHVVSLFAAGLFSILLLQQTLTLGSSYLAAFELGFKASANSMVLVALIGVLLAALVYFIGDRSTKSHSPYEHFYNGIMFVFMFMAQALVFTIVGLLVVTPVGFMGSAIWNDIARYWTVGLAAVIALVIGLKYNKVRHQKPVYEYAPFQVGFAAPVIAMAAVLAAAQVPQIYTDMVQGLYDWVLAYSVALIALIAAAITPLSVTKVKNIGAKLTEVAVSILIFGMSLFIFSYIPLTGFGTAMSTVALPSVFAVLVWLAYIYYYYYRKT